MEGEEERKGGGLLLAKNPAGALGASSYVCNWPRSIYDILKYNHSTWIRHCHSATTCFGVAGYLNNTLVLMIYYY